MGTVTEKQKTFIATLLAEREIPANIHEYFTKHVESGIDSKRASDVISTLLTYPKPRLATPAPTSWAAANAAVANLDTSFYAIPAGYVSAQSIELRGNDHLFVRVRNIGGGRIRLSRVSGSVGGFSYRGMSAAHQIVIAAIIEQNAQHFQQEFHRLTGRCGRCAAELTDLTSREKGFGPDCAKIVGV